jgi:hypothetical protein
MSEKPKPQPDELIRALEAQNDWRAKALLKLAEAASKHACPANFHIKCGTWDPAMGYWTGNCSKGEAYACWLKYALEED